MKHLFSRKGFTLIEMLVVVAIISVLAGVVLTGVAGFQANARDTRRIGDLKNVQNFLELYFAKCGYYPGSLLDAGGACSTTDNAVTPGSATGWGNLAITMNRLGVSNFPKDPVTTRWYEYGVGPEHLSYVIKASLERGNKVLDDDVDDTAIYTISCADTSTNFYYCIKS